MVANNLTDEDYLKLKESYAHLFTLLFPVFDMAPEKHPIAVLESMEKSAPSRARKGLEMAIGDMLEMTSGWSLEKVATLDKQLDLTDAFNLSQLRRRFSKKYAGILKRGKIRNIEEYYLLKGVLDGVSIEPEESANLTQLLSDFENLGKN